MGDKSTQIIIQTGQAQKNLADLRDQLKKTSDDLQAVKKNKGSREEVAQAQKAFAEAKKNLGMYQREVRQTHIALGELDKLNFKELLKASRELGWELEKLDRNSEEYKEKMSQMQAVRAEIKRVREEMNGVSSDTLTGSKALEAMVAQGKTLEEIPLNQLTKLEQELTAEIGNAVQGTEEFIEANEKLQAVKAQIANVKTEMQALGEELNKKSFGEELRDGLKNFGESLIKIPSSVGEAVTMGLNKIRNFTRQSIQDFKTFEEKSKNLEALTGLKGDDLSFLESEARRLATTVTDSASEIVDAFTLMGSAKPELLSDKEALSQVTEAALTLAGAAKMDAKKAVESLAATMNQFGADAQQADRYINALAAGSQAGSASVDEVARSIVKFGATAAAANLSVEDSVGLIETLAEKGVKSEEAGTKLNGVLLALQTSAEDKFNPAIVGMETALENLANANLNTAEKVKLFGKGNVVAGQILIENRESFKRLKEAVTDTNTAYEQSATNADNLATRQKLAENTIQNIRIELGQKLMPIVAKFYEGLQAFAQWIGPAIHALSPVFRVVKKTFVGIMQLVVSIKNGIVLLYEKAEPVFNALGKVVKALLIPLQYMFDLIGDLSDVLRSASDVTKEYTKTLNKEQTELDMLCNEIKNTTEGTEERNAAIAKLNKQYGKYLPQLLDEKSSLNEIETAQKLANEALRYNIALKMQEEQLSALQRDSMEQEMEQREKLGEILREAAGANYDIAKREMEAILNDPESEKKLEAFKQKWKINGDRFFGTGLDRVVSKIQDIKKKVVTESQEIQDAFSGVLSMAKPQEYNHTQSEEKQNTNRTGGVLEQDIDYDPDNPDDEPKIIAKTKSTTAAKEKARRDVIDQWRAEETLALKQSLENQEITHKEYLEREKELELSYLLAKRQQKIDAKEDTIEIDTQIADFKIKQQAAAQEQLAREHEEALFLLKQRLADETITQEEYQAQLEAEELAYLERKREALVLAGEDTLALDAQILDKQMAMREKARQEEEKEWEEALAIGKALRDKELKEKEEAAKKEADILRKKSEAYKQHYERIRSMGETLGGQIAQFATDATFTAEKFGANLAKMALDALHVVVRQSIASIWAQSMSSPESILTFGASGAIKAAAITAIVEGAFQVAKSFIVGQKFRGTLDAKQDKQYTVVGEEDHKQYNVPYMGTIDSVRFVPRPTLISERGGEIVVDAARSRQIQMRYPWLLDQLRSVPQHSSGTLEDSNRATLSISHSQQSEGNTQTGYNTEMLSLLQQLSTTVERLNMQLEDPLRAYLDRDELFSTLDRRKAIGS